MLAAPQSVLANPIKPAFDAVLIHKSGRQEAVPSNPANLPHFSKLRATKIRSIFRLPDLQAVIVSPGVFDFDNRPLELPPIEIYAPFGPELTTWKSSWHDGDNANNGNDGPQGPCFKGPATGVCAATGIHFQGPGYGPDGLWQQTVVGWIGDKTPGTQADPSDCDAALIHCRVTDGTFAVAIWGGYGNFLEIIQSTLHSARWAVTAGCSGGGDACFIDAKNSEFVVDASLSRHAGAQGRRAFGAACRGGSSCFTDCSFTVRGNETCEAVAAIWTPTTDTTQGDREAGSPHTKIVVVRSDMAVDPRGAKRWSHIEAGCGLVRVDKHSNGLGADSYSGNLVTRGNVQVGL